jgi:hypothetical protein
MYLTKKQLKKIIKEELHASINILLEEESSDADIDYANYMSGSPAEFNKCEDGRTAKYWADKLMDAMEGNGTNDETVVKIAKMGCAGQIKLAFERRYREYPLEEWLLDEFDANDAERKAGKILIDRFDNAAAQVEKVKEKWEEMNNKMVPLVKSLIEDHKVIEKLPKWEERLNKINSYARIDDWTHIYYENKDGAKAKDPKYQYRSKYSPGHINNVDKVYNVMRDLFNEAGSALKDLREYSALKRHQYGFGVKVRKAIAGSAINEGAMYEDIRSDHALSKLMNKIGGAVESGVKYVQRGSNIKKDMEELSDMYEVVRVLTNQLWRKMQGVQGYLTAIININKAEKTREKIKPGDQMSGGLSIDQPKPTMSMADPKQLQKTASKKEKWIGKTGPQVMAALKKEFGIDYTKGWHKKLPYKHPARKKFREWYTASKSGTKTANKAI